MFFYFIDVFFDVITGVHCSSYIIPIKEDIPFVQKLRIYNYGDSLYCSEGNVRSWISYFKGFYAGCCQKCPDTKQRFIATAIQNNGEDWAKKRYHKINDTITEKYGDTLQNSFSEEKIKTNLEKYGAKHHMKNKEYLPNTWLHDLIGI